MVMFFDIQPRNKFGWQLASSLAMIVSVLVDSF